MICTDHMPQSLNEALVKWDKGECIPTIEMGGIGPGYEQCIQVGVFELARKLQDIALPVATDALNKSLDEQLHKTIKENEIMSGLSGAQAGAIKNLAYHYVSRGYIPSLKGVEDKRIIYVTKKI